MIRRLLWAAFSSGVLHDNPCPFRTAQTQFQYTLDSSRRKGYLCLVYNWFTTSLLQNPNHPKTRSTLQGQRLAISRGLPTSGGCGIEGAGDSGTISCVPLPAFSSLGPAVPLTTTPSSPFPTCLLDQHNPPAYDCGHGRHYPRAGHRDRRLEVSVTFPCDSLVSLTNSNANRALASLTQAAFRGVKSKPPWLPTPN